MLENVYILNLKRSIYIAHPLYTKATVNRSFKFLNTFVINAKVTYKKLIFNWALQKHYFCNLFLLQVQKNWRSCIKLVLFRYKEGLYNADTDGSMQNVYTDFQLYVSLQKTTEFINVISILNCIFSVYSKTLFYHCSNSSVYKINRW